MRLTNDIWEPCRWKKSMQPNWPHFKMIITSLKWAPEAPLHPPSLPTWLLFYIIIISSLFNPLQMPPLLCPSWQHGSYKSELCHSPTHHIYPCTCISAQILCLLWHSHARWSVHVCMLSHFSRVHLFLTLWTAAHQPPLPTGFSRHKYCNGLPCPPLEALPNLAIKPTSLTSPALEGEFFTTSTSYGLYLILKPAQQLWSRFHPLLQYFLLMWLMSSSLSCWSFPFA